MTAPVFDQYSEPAWLHRTRLVRADLGHVRRLLSDLDGPDRDARLAAASMRTVAMERQINAERPRTEVAALAWCTVRMELVRTVAPSDWWRDRLDALADRTQQAIQWHLGQL